MTWRALLLVLALTACATARPGSHELVMDGQRVLLEATDAGVYYLAVGYRPRREWLLPIGAHPIFVRRISEADALRLFTEMKEAK